MKERICALQRSCLSVRNVAILLDPLCTRFSLYTITSCVTQPWFVYYDISLILHSEFRFLNRKYFPDTLYILCICIYMCVYMHVSCFILLWKMKTKILSRYKRSLNIVFFCDFKIYSGLWPLSVSPRCQRVYTMTGQIQALQQSLQS